MEEGALLIALQEIDLDIRRATKRLDELPIKAKILETRKKRQEVQALRTKAEELVARLTRACAKNEDETAQVAEKLESEQAKVMSGDITNPKEVQYLTREMDSLRRRKEKLEMEDLELMERTEKARQQVGKVDVALEQLEAREASMTEEFKESGAELQRELDGLGKKRNTICTQIDPVLIERYEATRAAKGGVGAARLVDNICGACRMELPTQRLAELRSGPPIAQCPTCKRLLVIGDDGGNDA